MAPGRVHVVLADEGWILERCARELERRLAYVRVGTAPDPGADLTYYVNYAAHRGRASAREAAFFTHVEERAPEAAARFFAVARAVDAAVCMAERYAAALREAGVADVQTIVPGVDLESHRPRVRVGVVGRTYPTGRKGEALVRAVLDEPGIEWHFTGEGWPGPAERRAAEDMPRFYASVDYVLVPAFYEGGPMPLLEALACGREVIAPPVGFVPDYPHIEFRTGDAEDLRRVLRELVARREALREAVAHRTWEAWAAGHDALFRRLLAARRPAARGRAGGGRLRVLLALHAPERLEGGGGPSVRVPRLRDELRAQGVEADLAAEELPDPRGYDLVHAFNVWEPRAALAQLRHFRQRGVPIVFSPIYMDLAELAWAARAIPSLFHAASSPAELERYLAAAADGSLVADGLHRFGPNEIVPGWLAALAEMVGLADRLVALSRHEMARLFAAGVAPRPFTLVRNAVDAARFAAASPEPFAARYGVRDYVLCVGRLERRKNQLLLVHALRETAVPLVLVGAAAEPDYAELIRRHAGPGAVLVDRLPHDGDLLASAYAGARVFALPSWCEGAPLGALEAAAAGARLVLSNRSGEVEYLGGLAAYVDPGSAAAIREAVLRAYEAGPIAPAERETRRARAAAHGWPGAARATIEAYREAVTRPAPTIHVPSAVARRLEIGSGTDPQPGYEHLDARPDLPCLEYVHAIEQPLPFPDATWDEILSRSCLEHVSWRDVRRILEDWRRVLKPGGVLRIYMPDLEYLCRMYLAGKADEHLHPSYVESADALLGGYSPSAWATIKMFGGQEYPGNFHAAAYDFPTFARVLARAGFARVERVPPYHGLYVVASRE